MIRITAVDMSGMYFTDNPDNPTKWKCRMASRFRRAAIWSLSPTTRPRRVSSTPTSI
jgi:hypothetical protein